MSYKDEMAKIYKAIDKAGSLLAAKIPMYKKMWVVRDMYADFDYIMTYNERTRKCYIWHKDAPECYGENGVCCFYHKLVVTPENSLNIDENIKAYEQMWLDVYGRLPYEAQILSV